MIVKAGVIPKILKNSLKFSPIKIYDFTLIKNNIKRIKAIRAHIFNCPKTLKLMRDNVKHKVFDNSSLSKSPKKGLYDLFK